MTVDQRGKCRACGIDLVDWDRLHQREIEDVEHTFESLQHELIRHRFFHQPIDDGAIRHAKRKGRVKLKEAAKHRLEKYLAPAYPVRDGRQTPFVGNAIYYAQHATATCCRTCLEYWHGIPKGQDLTTQELEYCTQLVDLFIDKRLPDLQDKPEKIPRIRHSSSGRREDS